VISKTGIAPSSIELEITESYIATNADSAMKTLQTIRGMGVKLAIDDFGTGYSSMNYLQQLPITRLKIDKIFVHGLPYHQGNKAICRAMIGLARTFELSITVEGIETQEQMQFFVDEQCDEGQGYYYSRPVTFDKLPEVCNQLRQIKTVNHKKVSYLK
jgi:EAL domain-containing protein (putative c-di-GMP-specific phosphodiesterase class I)